MWDYQQLPQSDFLYTIGPGTNQVNFTPLNNGISQTYYWDFGDGFNSSALNPTHSYSSNGTYTVMLTTTNCDLDGTHTSTSDTIIQFCSHTPFVFAADSFLCEYDTLWTQPADSYQWYSDGLPVGVTTQFLPDYNQYNSMDFSVLTTLTGCNELSQVYNANPQLSGYYFDAAFGGDPCEGDTALFIVLHTSSSLLGTEIIRWYKNDTLLGLANDQDTLLITTEGNYYCKVIDPASSCPFDTTVSSPILFDCGTVSTEEIIQDVCWKIYPNPVSEYLIINISVNINIGQEDIYIYSATGYLIRTIKTAFPMQLDVTDLPSGQYYIRIRNYPQIAMKFIKQ